GRKRGMERQRQRHPDTGTPEDEGIPEMEGPPEGQEETSDSPAGMVIPRDEPQASDEHGTTATEQRDGESLGERLAEEEPERAPGTARDQAGRLQEDDVAGVDTEKDLVAEEADDDTLGLTAEEDAMRVQDAAPGAVDEPDDYVDERD
ncbi:MAG TPA: hypothetical protein VG709_05630, partial [Actinomycetota bacterium]|nr:hypothetical protein [Actinomycetota bacterium]